MSEQWPAESSRYNRDFTYDGSGNQTKSVYRGSDTREITWNEDDEPITIAFNTQVRSKNLYDGEGQRAVSQHLVSALEETAYVSPDLTIRDGKYLTKHVYAGTTQLASKMDSAWLNYPPTLYFHTDQLNSTQYASMDDQTLIQHDEYFPSGELWRDETDSRYELARRHTFTGKELDIGTGLYYFGARYYDGHTSQWLSPDPILGRYLEGAINRGVYSPKNLGLYTFAWNNPTTRIDSNGLFVDEARQAVEVTTKVLAPGVPVALAEPTPAGEIILAGAFAVAVVGAFIYYEVSGSDSPKPSTPAPAPPSGVTPAAPAPPPAAAPPPPAPTPEAGGGGAKEPPKPPPPVTTAPDPGPPRGVPRPNVTDPKLKNLVKDLYKGANTKNPIGTGSTADAIRHEAATGRAVGGKFHTQKGIEYARALESWLAKNPGASAADRSAAQSILKDLRGALGGK